MKINWNFKSPPDNDLMAINCEHSGAVWCGVSCERQRVKCFNSNALYEDATKTTPYRKATVNVVKRSEANTAAARNGTR